MRAPPPRRPPADAVFATARAVILAGVATALLFARAAGWYLIHAVAKPVVEMTGAMSRLAERDMAVAIPAIGRRDEIGRMAAAVQVFRDSMIKADALAAAEAEAHATRTRRAEALDALTRTFGAEVNGVVEGLASASTQLQSSAETMSATAEASGEVARSASALKHSVTRFLEGIKAA